MSVGLRTPLSEIIFDIEHDRFPNLTMDMCERAVAHSWEQGFDEEPGSSRNEQDRGYYQQMLWLLTRIRQECSPS